MFDREEIWKKNQYESCNFEIPSEEDSDDSQSPDNEREEEEEEEEATVHYVVGDVTHPQCTNDSSAIVVHVLGKNVLQNFISYRIFYIRKLQSGRNPSWASIFAGLGLIHLGR